MEEHNPLPAPVYDDEITLKELILKLGEFWNYLWSAKWWIILCSIVIGAFMIIRTLREPTLYPAELTFMVNEDEGNNLGAVASVLGQFGFNAGNKSEFNLDKILELSRSKRIIYPSLFDTVWIDGTPQLMANHIIDIYEYHESWADSKDETLHNFLFSEPNHQEVSITGQKALKSIYTKVVGNEKRSNDPLLESQYGEETGILSLTVTAESEALAITLVNSIYQYLSEYYISKSIEPQQSTVDALSVKTDSLKKALTDAEFRLAAYDDSNLSLFSQKDRIRRDRLAREVSILTILYGETLKNFETASFALQNNTPFFQVIDPPIAPISPPPKSLIRALVIGLVLGGFLAALFFIFQKIYRDAMTS